MDNVSHCLNLRHLAEPLGKAVGLVEEMSFKEATKSVCTCRTANARREQVPESEGRAAMLKPREAKVVRTRGTNSNK